MSENFFVAQINTTGTRVPLETEGLEEYFIKDWKDSTKRAFFEQHVGNGKVNIYLIPKDFDTKLKNIRQNAQNEMNQYTVRYKGGRVRYFTKDSYRLYEQKFDKYRIQYLELVESMVDDYETIKEEFFKGVRKFVKNIDEQLKVIAQLEGSILPLSTFFNQFSFELIILDDDKLMGKETFATSLNIAKCLLESWDVSYKKNNRCIHPFTLNLLDSKIEMIKSFDVEKDPDLQLILNDFNEIVKKEGKGSATQKIMNSIKDQIKALGKKKDIVDLLN